MVLPGRYKRGVTNHTSEFCAAMGMDGVFFYGGRGVGSIRLDKKKYSFVGASKGLPMIKFLQEELAYARGIWGHFQPGAEISKDTVLGQNDLVVLRVPSGVKFSPGCPPDPKSSRCSDDEKTVPAAQVEPKSQEEVAASQVEPESQA